MKNPDNNNEMRRGTMCFYLRRFSNFSQIEWLQAVVFKSPLCKVTKEFYELQQLQVPKSISKGAFFAFPNNHLNEFDKNTNRTDGFLLPNERNVPPEILFHS